jgi:hypothetical protein
MSIQNSGNGAVHTEETQSLDAVADQAKAAALAEKAEVEAARAAKKEAKAAATSAGHNRQKGSPPITIQRTWSKRVYATTIKQ